MRTERELSSMEWLSVPKKLLSKFILDFQVLREGEKGKCRCRARAGHDWPRGHEQGGNMRYT
jgi:hypothetical protein